MVAYRQDNSKIHQKSSVDFRSPLIMGSLGTWLTLLYQYGGFNPKYLKRSTYILAGTLATAPLQLFEHLRYQTRIAKTQIHQPPVFILGHWRSGTTLLHYMLNEDPRFSTVSAQQGIAPSIFLSTNRLFRPLFDQAIPKNRAFDRMRMSRDLPLEDEIPLACTTANSYYHALSYPQLTMRFYQRFGTFEKATVREKAEWQAAYLNILKKSTLLTGNKPLLLKNPINTVRIPQLLELFPDAKFIYLYRDPYRVFLSTRHFWRRTLAQTQLHDIGLSQIETNFLGVYADMFRRYQRDSQLIPEDQLFELSFERFREDPNLILEAMYQRFGWGWTQELADAFIDYWDREVDYAQNEYTMCSEDIRKVNHHWGDALDAFGYMCRTP